MRVRKVRLGMGQQGASVLLGEQCDACSWLSLDIVVRVWGLQFHLGEVKRTIFDVLCLATFALILLS